MHETRVIFNDSPAGLTAVDVVRRLRSAGHGAWLVGGCVRDLLLGLRPKDYDVATSAHPPQVLTLFEHVIEVGVAFGVVRVRHCTQRGEGLHEIEVATFRTDLGYSDGRRPDAVAFTDEREDVLRRDFTINGLLLDPLDCTREGCRVVDHVGGLRDLEDELLRAIGQPDQRFAEDALRLLRAPRFAARFGLRMEPETALSIRRAAPTLSRVSAERIAMEVQGMLTVPTAPSALHLLHDLGLDAVLWPELEASDPELLDTQASFRRLWLQHTPEPMPGAFQPCHGVTWPLALALLLWPVRAQSPMQRLVPAWKLSKHDGQALDRTWKLAEALRTSAAEGPEQMRLLREDEADAALRLLQAREPSPRWAPWRQVRAETPIERWRPVLHVSGEALIERGFRPGPRFREALRAAEDVQLTGGTAASSLTAALAALERDRPS